MKKNPKIQQKRPLESVFFMKLYNLYYTKLTLLRVFLQFVAIKYNPLGHSNCDNQKGCRKSENTPLVKQTICQVHNFHLAFKAH